MNISEILGWELIIFAPIAMLTVCGALVYALYKAGQASR